MQGRRKHKSGRNISMNFGKLSLCITSRTGSGVLMLEQDVGAVYHFAKDEVNKVTSRIRYKRLTEILKM